MKSILFTSEEKTAEKAIDNAFDEFDNWLRVHSGKIVSLSHHVIKEEHTADTSYLASIIVVIDNHLL